MDNKFSSSRAKHKMEHVCGQLRKWEGKDTKKITNQVSMMENVGLFIGNCYKKKGRHRAEGPSISH